MKAIEALDLLHENRNAYHVLNAFTALGNAMIKKSGNIRMDSYFTLTELTGGTNTLLVGDQTFVVRDVEGAIDVFVKTIETSKLSASKVSIMSGVSTTAILGWKRGTVPKLDNFIRACEVVGIYFHLDMGREK